jgi:uncharacterized protein
MTPSYSALYFGDVVHQRLRPFGHRFRYRVFSLLVDLDEIDGLARRSNFFSRNRLNLFSFYDKDHGPRDGGSLRPWIKDKLANAGIDIGAGRIEILCFPRVLGYVFNPLSVWFCRDEQQQLRAVLYEVSNTFGERMSYLVPTPRAVSGRALRHETRKQFHVSPFLEMDQVYLFHLRVPDEHYSLAIRLRDHEGPVLFAAQTAARQPFSDVNLVKAFVAYPLMTLKVIAAIHYEALRLLLKGARYIEKPARPTSDVVVVSPPFSAAAE